METRAPSPPVTAAFTGQREEGEVDTNSMEWVRLQQRGEQPKARAYHAAAVVGNFLVVLGGWSGSCENLASLSTLDLDGIGTWASVGVPGQPPKQKKNATVTSPVISILSAYQAQLFAQI